MLCAGSEEELQLLTSQLRARYEITDDSEPSFFLGVAVHRDRASGKLCLSQEAYTSRTLALYNMADCHSVPTPADQQRLSKAMSPSGEAERAEMRRVPYDTARRWAP